jgi:hypothetical protein
MSLALSHAASYQHIASLYVKKSSASEPVATKIKMQSQRRTTGFELTKLLSVS